jgi:hypothetical protein
VVSAAVDPVIGAVSAVVEASMAAAPVAVGNFHQFPTPISVQKTQSTFFPIDCFVPLQIP